MYKVFIENRTVIFSTKKDKSLANVQLKGTHFEADILPLVIALDKGGELNIEMDNLEQYDEIFKNHERIIAAGGLVRRKNKLLFIKRNGVWDIPKGKVEEDESIPEAAVREVEEECGLKNVELGEFLMKTYHTYKFENKWVLKETHWFKMIYDGPKETSPQLDEGITKVKWYEIGNEGKVLKNTYPSIIEVIKCYSEKL